MEDSHGNAGIYAITQSTLMNSNFSSCVECYSCFDDTDLATYTASNNYVYAAPEFRQHSVLQLLWVLHFNTTQLLSMHSVFNTHLLSVMLKCLFCPFTN